MIQCSRCPDAREANWQVSNSRHFSGRHANDAVSLSSAMAVRCPINQRSLKLTRPDMAMSQALELTSDLKLGWYTSIPPRQMFACQVLGAVIGALTNCTPLHRHVAGRLTYRHNPHIGNLLQKTVPRRNDPRPDRSMDRESPFDLLFSLNNLGSSSSSSVLQREVYMVVYGFRTWRYSTPCRVLGTQEMAWKEDQ